MHVLILPSSYPTNADDVRGVFYRDQALALAAEGAHVGVVAPRLRSVKQLLRLEPVQRGTSVEDDHGVTTLRREAWPVAPAIPYANYFIWRRVANGLLQEYMAREGRPEVVHAHCARFAGAVAARWVLKHDLPLVLTEHSSTFAEGTLRFWEMALARRAAELAHARAAVSPSLSRTLARQLGIPASEWQWIPNLIPGRFQEPRQSPPGSGQGLRFLNVGAMVERKGQADLLSAFAAAFPRGSEFELWLAGEGPAEPGLREQAKKLSVAHRVRFLGRVPPRSMPGLMRSVDVVVVSSHRETFGVVVIEALACGTPVVATRCGGPECIVGEQDGLLVPPGDPKRLAEGLLEIAGRLDRLDHREIAERARQRFSAPIVARQLLDVYERVVRQGARARERA